MRSALIALSIMAAWSGLLAAHNACAMITNKRLKEVYRGTVKIMKPVRGSERASSKAPKGKKTGEKPNKPGIKTRQRRVSREEPQPGTSSQIPQPKPQKKKKKKGGTVASPRKLKGQEKWKPLTKASITALDNILGLSILSVLAGRRTNKEESQKHLNIVKNRFLSKLAQLSVPIQKQEMMSHSSRQHQEETRKSAVGKKILNKLVILQLSEQGVLRLPCTSAQRQTLTGADGVSGSLNTPSPRPVAWPRSSRHQGRSRMPRPYWNEPTDTLTAWSLHLQLSANSRNPSRLVGQ
ncbi:centromere protein Q isoform X3 [Oncorhynchus nerka]|uniref:centromere protein Q isoform X3 n=1 Tax=Oncorhynchus nerka TaxID=8023 RepID=UPI0031B81D78